MNDDQARPPRFLELLLRQILPADIRGESILGDLRDEHADLLTARGPRAAGRWYRRQAVGLMLEYLRPGRRRLLPDPGSIVQGLRHTVRRLVRAPAFSLTSIVTLALGVGATAAIFSVINAVLWRPLPYGEADRLVFLEHTAPGWGMDRIGFADAAYLHYREHGDAFEEMAIFRGGGLTLTGGEQPERIHAAAVTASLFSTLQAKPALGRPLTPEDDQPDAARVALLSHAFWAGHFGADPTVLGRSLEVEGAAVEIVGVMPEGFRLLTPPRRLRMDRESGAVDLWLPGQLDPSRAIVANFIHGAVGRLRAGVSIDEAAASLNRLLPGLSEAYPGPVTPTMMEHGGLAVVVTPLKEAVVGDVAQLLLVLLGGIGLVLVIAAANVTHLFLVRAETGRGEMALRAALGAGRLQLLRHLLAESSLIAIGGGVGGLLLALLGVRLFLQRAADSLPRLSEVAIDGEVLALVALLSLGAALIVGIVPSLRQPTSLPLGGTPQRASHQRQPARGILLVVQVALAVVLLVAAGLMLRTVGNLSSVDPGFDGDNVLTMRIMLPEGRRADDSAVAEFHLQLLERLTRVPGLEASTVASGVPLDGTFLAEPLGVEDFPWKAEEMPPAVLRHFTSPGYFATFGIPLLAGRDLEPGDSAQRLGNVVVNSAFARRYWPDGNALGKRIRFAVDVPDLWYTIVGVVGDVRDQALVAAPAPIVYYPMTLQEGGNYGIPVSSWAVAVRTAGDPRSFVTQIRETIWSLDPNVPVVDVQTMQELRASTTARISFTLILLGTAAAGALLLGAIGTYGVVSYLVAQRTPEIGLRMALGARSKQVTRMVLLHNAWMSLVGLLLGLIGAWATSRALASLLFGVEPTDFATYGGVVFLLLLVTLAASYLPARRAARVEPARVLRDC